ncbi:MAG: lytic murein transglycosylase [Paracoccaceae bacterium]
MRFLALPLAFLATPLIAQDCGGPLPAFIEGVKAQAIAEGVPPSAADSFFAGAQIDSEVIAADRRQGVFQLDFVTFSRRLISQNRIDNGNAMSQRYDDTFDRIESEYGIPRGVLLAFWAFETDYGQVQGDFNTRDALLTLAHDCRRPELFRPQLIAGIKLHARGDFDVNTTEGAWAGEIGQLQKLPKEILEQGVDGDGDGRVDLRNSAPDALMTGAQVLSSLGWQANEPWLQEIDVPSDFNLSLTGLDTELTIADWTDLGVTPRSGSLPAQDKTASVLLPVGREGPAFLAYPNFSVYFEWNQSFVYVATAAYFATRLEGAPVFDTGTFSEGLSGEEVTRLQEKLQARGYDVGGSDGIIGAMTRDAVQKEQERLGFPADAWPTRELLNAL